MSWLTIDISRDVETGQVTVVTRASKNHWDDDCPCEDPHNPEPDIHDDIITTHHPAGVRLRTFKAVRSVEALGMELFFVKDKK